MEEKMFLQCFSMTETERFYQKLWRKRPEVYQTPVKSWEDFRSRYGEGMEEEIHLPAFSPTIMEERFHEKSFFPLAIGGDVAVIVNSRYCPPFLHTLEFIKIICVYRGSCQFYVEDRWTTIRQGNFCIVAPDVRQTVFSSKEEDIVINFLVRRSTFAEEFEEFLKMSEGGIISDFFWKMLYNKPEGEVLLFRSRSESQLQETVRELYREAYLTQVKSPLIIKSLIWTVFVYLLRDHAQEAVNLKKMSDTAYPLASYMRYIYQNLNTVSLSALAEKYHRSEGYLSRYFRRETGSTYSQIIRAFRLKRAKELLLRTDCSITYIIDMVGYQDESIFFRNFKARYGLTPLAFRKKNHVNFMMNYGENLADKSVNNHPASKYADVSYLSGEEKIKEIRPLAPDECMYREWYRQNPEIWEQPVSDWQELIHRCRMAGIHNVSSEAPTPVASFFQEEDFFEKDEDDVVCFENSRYCPPFIHRLEFIKIVYVYSGSLTLWLNDIRYELECGNFCIITPGIIHTVFSQNDNDCVYNLLIRISTFSDSFSGVLMEQNILSEFFWRILYTKHSNRILLFRSKSDKRLDNWIKKIAEERETDPLENRMLRKGYAMAFIGTAMRDHLGELQIPEASDCGIYHLPAIIQYMNSHLQDAALSETAAYFRMGEDKLKYYIVNESGLTYRNLLRDLRLRKAAELLSNTGISIERIMEEAGYTNASNFYKSFRERYGKTPMEYRDSGEILI